MSNFIKNYCDECRDLWNKKPFAFLYFALFVIALILGLLFLL